MPTFRSYRVVRHSYPVEAFVTAEDLGLCVPAASKTVAEGQLRVLVDGLTREYFSHLKMPLLSENGQYAHTYILEQGHRESWTKVCDFDPDPVEELTNREPVPTG